MDDDQAITFPKSFNSPGRSRTNSERSDSSRESFLDNVPARASFSFKLEQKKQQQLMAEDEKFDKYRLKLKGISLFFVFFSVFILLNASIGASSAPFYDKYTECSKYELTHECKELMKYTSALYGFEVIGSLILSFHGLIGMTLLEYIKKIWLIRTLNYYTKVALILYILDAILRCSIYFKILELVNGVEEANHEQDYGGFLAVYCENQALSIIVTTLLLLIYSACFLSTCFMWHLTKQLHKTAVEVEEEKEKAAARHNRSSSKSLSEKPTSISNGVSINDSEAPSNQFEHYEYNEKRAQRASQVILSINNGEDDEHQAMPLQEIRSHSYDEGGMAHAQAYDSDLVRGQIAEEASPRNEGF